ncbi:MAG: M23 family metallopeptidase [Myxococcota bacterium]|nr:M23 family metallopeptidase [Myxococcota bacterium]
MRWPVEPTAISSLFGKRLDPITRDHSFHRGVDLASPYGAIVTAAAGGQVTSAGWNQEHGRQVIVTHPEGYRTVYSHLSQITVFPQDCITQGQAIGRVGSSGRSTGPHLHFELTRRGKALDPLEHLDVPLPPMAHSGSSKPRDANDFDGG